LRAIQRSYKKLWAFQTSTVISSDAPPPIRVAIPHLLQGKRHPEPPVKI
jgi:hypothetical protein